MRIYYLDEPLNEDELAFVEQSLTQFEGLKSIQNVEQVRVPKILPLPRRSRSSEKEVDKNLQIAMNALKRAGLRRDVGSQITWVLPKEGHWGAIFQLAILEVTGFGPYVVQKWRYVGDELVDGPIRFLDAQGLMGAKE